MISRISKRIRGHNNSSFIGLDSFMDIVTNVIGALFFVIIYAALSTNLAKGKETLPIAKTPDTERIIFECRANTAFYPEFEKMLNRASKRLDKLYEEGGADKIIEEVNNVNIENDFYKHEYDLFSIGNILIDIGNKFIPKSDSKGEDVLQIEEENSKFQRELAKLDPKKHHIIFFVRTDSYHVFHIARRIAIKKGFGVGWEPINPNDPVSFGRGGRDIPIF